MRIPVTAKLLEQHRGERGIVFHETIESAERILRILRARGHQAEMYHSRMSKALRRDNLRLFRRGMVDVLVTCRALDEGLDVPDASVAVIAASTASVRQRIQRLGRVLRPSAGKEAAVVYTLYCTPPEARRLEDEARHLATDATVTWHKVHGI